MTDLQSQVEAWKQQGYMVSHRGTLVLTQKFYEVLGQTPPVKAPGDYKEKYLTFIKEVFGEKRVRLPIGNGTGEYTVSDFSKPGLDAFQKVLKTPGMDYTRLVNTTKEFYLDPRNSRPTITNYFVKELWVSVYQSYIPRSVPLTQSLLTASNNELG